MQSTTSPIAWRRFVWTFLATIAVGPTVAVVAQQPTPIRISEISHPGPVDFEKEILPVLRRHCLACHNSTDAESDLVLETPQSILRGGGEGPAVIPGDAAESLLLKLAAHQAEPVMPPADNNVSAKPLTPEQLGLLKLWIQQGAKGETQPNAPPIVFEKLPPGVNPIYAVAISPDGQFAAAGRANQVFLYHVPTRREMGRLTDAQLVSSGIYQNPGVAHLDLVQALAFSPDNQLLASGGYRVAKLWRRTNHVRAAHGHGLEGPPQALAVSRDRRHVAIGQQNGSMKLFEAGTGQVKDTFSGHAAAVSAVDFSADGHYLVSGSQDKSFRVWDLATGKLLGNPTETPAPIGAVVFVNDDQQIATGHADNLIRIWQRPTPGASQDTDSNDESPAATAPMARELKGHSGAITSLAALPPRGAELLSGSVDATARVWNVASGSSVRQLNHGGPITALAVRPDGKRLATVSANHTGKLWDASNGKQIAELKGDFRAKIATGDAKRLVALAARKVADAKKDLDDANKRKKDEEESAKKADEAHKKAQDEFNKKDEAAKRAADAELVNAQNRVKQSEEKVKQLAGPAQKASDEKTAAERARDATLRTLERARQAVQRAADAIPRFEQAVKQAEANQQQQSAALDAANRRVAATEKPVLAVAFSPDGSTLATAGEDCVVHTWDGETGVAIDSLRGHDAPISQLCFLTDNQVLSAASDNSVIVNETTARWNLERVIGSIDSPILVDRVTALAFSPDGKLLATGSGEPSRSGQLSIWNVGDGSLLREIDEPHTDTVFAAAFSPDGQMLASCGADRFVKVFQVSDGTLVMSFEGHTHHVLGVTWRADGRILASAGADKVVKLWDFRTGDQVRTIQGFGKEVTGIRFLVSPDGNNIVNLVAACGDQNVYTKNADNGGNGPRLSGATDYVYSVDATSDGTTIVAAGQDSVVRIWQSNGQLLASFPPPQPAPATAGGSGS